MATVPLEEAVLQCVGKKLYFSAWYKDTTSCVGSLECGDFTLYQAQEQEQTR